MTNQISNRPTFKSTSGLQARLQPQTKSAPTATPMWSLQGSIFQETALQVLDQRGSKAHRAIGVMVTELNLLGELSQDDMTQAVKDAMATWSQLLWAD